MEARIHSEKQCGLPSFINIHKTRWRNKCLLLSNFSPFLKEKYSVSKKNNIHSHSYIDANDPKEGTKICIHKYIHTHIYIYTKRHENMKKMLPTKEIFPNLHIKDCKQVKTRKIKLKKLPSLTTFDDHEFNTIMMKYLTISF